MKKEDAIKNRAMAVAESRAAQFPTGMFAPLSVAEKITGAKGYRLADDGTAERQCYKCKEWWPADTEFYGIDHRKNTLKSWCRACFLENCRMRAEKLRQAKAKQVAA